MIYNMANGYSAGYSNGYSDGNTAGYNTGYSAGESAGYSSGYSAGSNAGYSSGYSAGSTAGYNSGYSAGQASMSVITVANFTNLTADQINNKGIAVQVGNGKYMVSGTIFKSTSSAANVNPIWTGMWSNETGSTMAYDSYTLASNTTPAAARWYGPGKVVIKSEGQSNGRYSVSITVVGPASATISQVN